LKAMTRITSLKLTCISHKEEKEEEIQLEVLNCP
jgi:hypothetical protein